MTSIILMLIKCFNVKNQKAFQRYSLFWEIISVTQCLTPKTARPKTSFATKSTISISAIIISWNGDAFPSTTPNEISTAAEAKSAVSNLKCETVSCKYYSNIIVHLSFVSWWVALLTKAMTIR